MNEAHIHLHTVEKKEGRRKETEEESKKVQNWKCQSIFEEKEIISNPNYTQIFYKSIRLKLRYENHYH